MKNVIEIHGLSYAYGSKKVLNEINLAVPTGTFYALLGRNGAGKTTLLKILAGITGVKAWHGIGARAGCPEPRPQ
jgi:ABC-type multidrug transport system ATPase subunit